ncbi:deaminase [Jiangella ureilytica]|nr:deaminase [Jiangella ureilytica]
MSDGDSDGAAAARGPESHVREAMRLAEEAAAAGNRPFGAVVVDAHGVVVVRERNRVAEWRDPLAHAEINAIRAACRAAGTVTLTGFRLYTNAAPCAMCLSAMVIAGIAVVGYGAPREPGTVPAVGVAELASRSGPNRIEIQSDLVRAEAVAQLKRLTGTAT